MSISKSNIRSQCKGLSNGNPYHNVSYDTETGSQQKISKSPKSINRYCFWIKFEWQRQWQCRWKCTNVKIKVKVKVRLIIPSYEQILTLDQWFVRVSKCQCTCQCKFQCQCQCQNISQCVIWHRNRVSTKNLPKSKKHKQVLLLC